MCTTIKIVLGLLVGIVFISLVACSTTGKNQYHADQRVNDNGKQLTAQSREVTRARYSVINPATSATRGGLR